MAPFDEGAFREDIAWRFRLARGALAQHEACGGANPGPAFGNDAVRFWRSLAGVPGERRGLAHAVRSQLLEPWRQTTLAVNRLHRLLHLAPEEMLAVSARAEARCGMEAIEWAQAYRSLHRDLAGPAVHLSRSMDSIRLDAAALAETQYMRSGWLTSAAELWLRLQHLAGCAYPLLPSFGAALWRALRLEGPPRWPALPGGWAVQPVALHGALLQGLPSGEDRREADVEPPWHAWPSRRIHGEHLA
jgi:hypothetical protein